MRRTEFFCETQRENPVDTDMEGHQLLLRGGFIQPLAAGIYSYLPPGQRVKQKIERILREEMNAIGGQEISMPVVHPAELWQETGRWYDWGPELIHFRDRGERDLLIGPTHEEIIADLLRKRIRSYRQLPVMLYQIHTKFRDEPRSRGGLIRAREFLMKDAYSCHATFEDLDRYYQLVYKAYLNVFQRAGIEIIGVESDVGMMGGTMAHEFMFLSEIGEDQIVICDSCGYSANRQVAAFRKDQVTHEDAKPVEEIETPGAATISELAELLQISESSTAKATFFTSGDRLIFAVVRGDMDVNETKLVNELGVKELRPASAEELRSAGIVAGYASPIGVKGSTVIVDDLVARSPNLVAGANRQGYHLLNTNYGRDYKADLVVDIASAYEGAPCSRCGGPIRIVRGVEVGNIFKLGTKYSEAMGATFLDEQGQIRPVVMASYGIGVGRLMACIAQGNRDERGLAWPVTVAPFDVYLVGLDAGDETVRLETENLYRNLTEQGIEVLYDDRRERAGVKFNDADLLGMPIRLTVSRRTLANGAVELKLRSRREVEHVSLEGAVSWVRSEIGRMRSEIQAKSG